MAMSLAQMFALMQLLVLILPGALSEWVWVDPNTRSVTRTDGETTNNAEQHSPAIAVKWLHGIDIVHAITIVGMLAFCSLLYSIFFLRKDGVDLGNAITSKTSAVLVTVAGNGIDTDQQDDFVGNDVEELDREAKSRVAPQFDEAEEQYDGDDGDDDEAICQSMVSGTDIHSTFKELKHRRPARFSPKASCALDLGDSHRNDNEEEEDDEDDEDDKDYDYHVQNRRCVVAPSLNNSEAFSGNNDNDDHDQDDDDAGDYDDCFEYDGHLDTVGTARPNVPVPGTIDDDDENVKTFDQLENKGSIEPEEVTKTEYLNMPLLSMTLADFVDDSSSNNKPTSQYGLFKGAELLSPLEPFVGARFNDSVSKPLQPEQLQQDDEFKSVLESLMRNNLESLVDTSEFTPLAVSASRKVPLKPWKVSSRRAREAAKAEAEVMAVKAVKPPTTTQFVDLSI